MPYITTLDEAEKSFILSRMERGCSLATIAYYKQGIGKLKAFIGANYGMSDAGEIPISILEKPNFKMDYMIYLRQTGNEQTVITYLRSYGSFAYFAMENEFIVRNRITIKDCEGHIKNCYTDAELGRLLVMPNKDDFNEYRSWVIVNFLLATGCRVSTLIDINIADICFDEGMMNLNRQKNKSPVRVPMVRRLAKVLRDYIGDYLEDLGASGPLFPRADGRRATESIIQKAIADYNRDRKVNKKSIHLFRHTFAKNWILSGGDLLTLQRMLNHKSLKMVQHYSNIYGADIKSHAEQFSLLNRVEQTRQPHKLVRRKA